MPSVPPPTITRIDLGGIPVGQSLDFGALWTVVQSKRDESLLLLRIDRDTKTVRRVALGRLQPEFLAASNGVWVSGCPNPKPNTNCPDGTVYRVDPTAAQVTGRVRVGDNITAMGATEDAVWVATRKVLLL